jgi:hypothetical protein
MIFMSGCVRHEGELNWSQGSLRDPAADGCPYQYHQYTTINHQSILTGCWGDSSHD